MISGDRPSQSWQSAIVDLAILGVLALFAIRAVREPAAWTLLGGIVSGRFGISFGKQLERVTGRSGGPTSSPGGGTSTSGQYRLDLPHGASGPPGPMRRLAFSFSPELRQRGIVFAAALVTLAVTVAWR